MDAGLEDDPTVAGLYAGDEEGLARGEGLAREKNDDSLLYYSTCSASLRPSWKSLIIPQVISSPPPFLPLPQQGPREKGGGQLTRSQQLEIDKEKEQLVSQHAVSNVCFLEASAEAHRPLTSLRTCGVRD